MFTNSTGQLTYVVQNTTNFVTGPFGATLWFAAYGTVAGSLRVSIAGSGNGGENSNLINYGTTLQYFPIPFTAAYNDDTFTIRLGGSSPGVASAQPYPTTVYFTDWSMTSGTINNNLEGSLTLLNGGLKANAVTSTGTLSAYFIDVQNELLVESYASSFLNGSTYCNGQLYASGGLTGATGSFGYLNSTVLNVGATGSFGNVSTNKLSVNGAKFTVDVNGNAITQNLTANGATNLQNLNCTTATASGDVTCQGALSVTNGATVGSATCLGTFSSGSVSSSGLGSFGRVSCGGTGSFGTVSCGGSTSLNALTATSASIGTLTATGATNLQALTCGTTTTGALTVGGSLSTSGSYGAWLKCTLYATNYSSTLQDVTWKAPTFSYGITGPNNSAAIRFTSAGVYKFDLQMHSNTTLTTARDFQLITNYSTDGSTWYVYENSEVNLAFTNGVEELWLNGMVQATANSYLKVTLGHNYTSDMVFNTGGQWSYMHVYRVG